MSNWKPNIPYNDLPPLPPKQDIESKTILKRCIAARASLARLKQAAELIPNQAMLINTLPVMEARASSEIENIVTTTDKLFQSLQMDTERQDPATKEALQYRTALFAGYESLTSRPLCTQTAIMVCNAIKHPYEMAIRKTGGTALKGGNSGNVVYTPPEGEETIRGKLENWERFIHESGDLDPLIIMAAAHYQFEAIHPFTDGNGRTGRILNSLLLIEKGLLDLPILYLSRYIIENRADYYRLLLGVTERQDWESWIIYILDGVADTADWTVSKIDAIRRLFEQTRQHIRTHAQGIYTHELVNLLFEQPYTRIANLEAAGIAKRQTASKYLKELSDIGVLQEIAIGRDKLFIHPRLMELLRGEGNSFTSFQSLVKA
ncbi:TPA: Fic family protein [Neisseria meningitidis]|uniref:protein adenylyltransferase Fic n=1 Tax=Neisseria TaxID=482 RepID=UPI00027C7BB0|nr:MULTISPECIES: Fic family protein [Neisseria]EJU78429.1 cell filamentation cAMP-inducing protein Fic [Neisseria meningitidis NM3001]OFQ09228.1 addiction module protein [Neisseria sp. HMSC070F02]RPD01574.1 addiction module protein [Neisseria meningitidis]RPD10247.1 addiction module protein [Neisseria meningitidis]RPD13816.1 addiction module protein [Neisseria meningitidis]